MRRFGLVLATGVAILVGNAWSASAGGVTQVRGLLEPDTAGVCQDLPDNFGAYTVSGSLVGCWYIDSITKEHTTPSGGYQATGTETFVGCLDDACGRFFTTFVFTAKWVDGVEVHGRCHHPIVGGDGDFSSISGVVQMHDLPNGCAVYNGGLKL